MGSRDGLGRAASRVVAVTLAVWAVADGVYRIVDAPLAATGNNALYLYAAGLLLDGELPYRDWWELNPPLITYLNVVPVLAARLLRLHPIPVFNVIVIALSVWSACTVIAFLRRLQPRVTTFDGLAIGFALMLTALTWPTSHGTSFGERDHLFTALYLPYLAIRLARWNGIELTKRAWMYGAAAALGALLKPHFVAAAIAPELALAIAHRRTPPMRSPETFAAGAVAALYLIHLAAIPAIGRPFVFELLPLVLTDYHAFDELRSVLLSSVGMAIVRAMPMFVLLALTARLSPLRMLLVPLLALYVAGNLAYIAHGKGWPYTYHVPRQAEVLLAAVMFSGVWHWLAARAYRWPRIGYAAALAASALAFAVTHAAAPNEVSEAAPIVGAETKRGDTVLILSTYGPAAYPTIVQLGLRQGSRYLWPFPALLFHADRIASGAPLSFDGPATDAERAFLESIAADVRTRRPTIVMIQQTPACERCGDRLTLAQYFRETRVVQDVVAEQYDGPESIGGFVLYRRRP